MGIIIEGSIIDLIGVDKTVPLTWNWQEHIGTAHVRSDGTIVAEVDEEFADLLRSKGAFSIGTTSR